MTGTVTVPDVTKLERKSLKELRNLFLAKCKWEETFSIGFTLSNGNSCLAGTSYEVINRYTFDPKKKITRIEATIRPDEWQIHQINFYSGEELLVTVGASEGKTRLASGRVEIF